MQKKLFSGMDNSFMKKTTVRIFKNQQNEVSIDII